MLRVILIVLVLLLTSCFTQTGKKMKKGVKEWSLHAEANAVYCGNIISNSPLSSPVIVVSVKEPEEANHFRTVINYQKLEKPSFYGFMAPVGKVSAFAFEDTNGNEKYDKGEPCGAYADGSEFILFDGRLLYGIDIKIEREAELPDKFTDLSMMFCHQQQFYCEKTALRQSCNNGLSLFCERIW